MKRFSVFPHGLSLGQGSFRPAIIFKDKTETEILPVWLDPVEANILIQASQQQPRDSSAHKASLKIFDALNVRLETVYFDDVTSTAQMATITAVQGKKIVEVKVRAAEAMSLALNAGVSFFTNHQVVEKSRALNFEMFLHTVPQGTVAGKEAMH